MLIFIGLLVMGAVGLITADLLILRDPKIVPNVYVAHVDVGGLLPVEAEKKMGEAVQAARGIPIIITDQNNVWFIQHADIDFSINVNKSLEAAYAVGREPNLFKRWRERFTVQETPRLLPVTVTLNQTKLIKEISKLSTQVDQKPRDAGLQVSLKTKMVALVHAIEGRKLDVNKTASHAFQTPQNHLSFVVELVVEKLAPKVPDEYYQGINTMLAVFSTNFNPWDYDRNANLRLATSRIHGKILKPGDIFSYNQNVGHRTQKEGFRMAPVILDGKLVPDWGGGVCQVSSTLYNAALLADLDIVDRSNHGRAIGYVPLGFDATVVDGLIDFKFKNNLKNAIMIYSEVTEDELVFAILGNVKDAPPPIELDYVVHKVIEPVEIKQQDPTLEVGKEVVDESPQRGFRVSTYRIRTINGKQSSQLLATDDYDPVNRIVKVGTKPGATPPPANKLTSKPNPKPTVSGRITL